jgi:hypothetical protein
MKFGIIFANTMTFTEPEGLKTLAQGAEAAGPSGSRSPGAAPAPTSRSR